MSLKDDLGRICPGKREFDQHMQDAREKLEEPQPGWMNKMGFRGKIYFHIPPWNNRWIPDLYHVFRDWIRVEDPVDADVLFSAWCDKTVLYWTRTFGDMKKIFTYVRRYEMWQHEVMQSIAWEHVNGIFLLSKYAKDLFLNLKYFKDPPPYDRCHIVYQGVDIDAIPLRKPHENTGKIAMVASARWEKNYALAAEIMSRLPNHTLHRIGLPGDLAYAGVISEYFKNRGVEMIDEGHITADQVLNWLSDKDCILCTSVSEGCPVNVIEAMAMGIGPVIHDWPGAREMFPSVNIFTNPETAIPMILRGSDTPTIYRQFVKEKYSISNLEALPVLVRGGYD